MSADEVIPGVLKSSHTAAFGLKQTSRGSRYEVRFCVSVVATATKFTFRDPLRGQLLLQAPRSAQIDLPIDLVVKICTGSSKQHLDLELAALVL